MPSPQTESGTLNEDTSNCAAANKGTNKSTSVASNVDSSQDTNARASLLKLTRRHSLPASYHLSNFLSFFSQNDLGSTHGGPNVNEARATPGPHSHTATTRTVADSDPAGQAPTSSSVNRHRYGHRHTRSAVLDQPVVVRTYNPPATPRLPTRAGMMNPAIYEEEDTQRVELPPIEAFSFDGILKAINPEVTRTLDRVSYLCLRLKEDVKAEIEVTVQTQREIHGQKQQAEKFAAQVLKVTNSRSETLAAEASGLKGGAAVDDLAQLTERTYTALGSIVSTLLAIDELLPPQDRLAPDYSAHQTHYPKVHQLLNKKYQEITARFGNSAIASGRSGEEARAIPKITRQSSDTGLSPPTSPSLLPPFLPNHTHQEPGWLRRRMSSSSAMLLSPNSTTPNQDSSVAAKRLSLPPQLQLRTILPAPSYGQSPPRNSNSGSRKVLAPGSSQSSNSMTTRRHSTNPLASHRNMGDRRATSQSVSGSLDGSSSKNTRCSSGSYSNRLFGIGSWTGTSKWIFFGSNGASSNESERGVSAEEKLRKVLNGFNGKGKAIERRA
ncbi:hypothetical protein BDZ91DRAFT_738819 [Kalaharituber pfeilii]|nr:hypothetical protein BDZ91DRAFT_738819 [Kalaharituber pfeilii]